MRRIDRVLHLRSCVSEHVRIGIGRSAAHIARIAEQIGGAPQELGSRLLHLLGKEIGHLGEVFAELLEAVALGNDVAIVEGEERKTKSREHLERHIGLGARAFHRLAVPWALEGRRAEHVGPHPGEVVPVANSRAQVLGHGLAHDHARGIVVAVSVGVIAFEPLKAYRVDVPEKALAHVSSFFSFDALVRIQYANARQFCAVSTPSQRASVLRSSSVIWLKLLGGIAWVSTACWRIAGAKRAMCSGVSSSTPFGASPISSIGSAAWHIMQRSWTMSTTSGGAFG